jgi:hypothetical protein
MYKSGMAAIKHEIEAKSRVKNVSSFAKSPLTILQQLPWVSRKAISRKKTCSHHLWRHPSSQNLQGEGTQDGG